MNSELRRGFSSHRAALLPGALVVGPMKSGTTWIDRYLRSRPDVCLPAQVKETNYFDRRYERGLSWYAGHFRWRGEGRALTVEVAPTYFHSETAPGRIREALGRVPLVVVLRDPVARAYSHYIHLRHYCRTTSSLRQAVLEHSAIVEASRYASHLRRWFSAFTPEDVRVLYYDELASDPQGFACSLCEHFGLQFYSIPDELLGPVNVALLPARHNLAAAGLAVSERLRSAGLYGVINLAKFAGLKRLFFGRPGKTAIPGIGAEDREWLRELILPEIESLESLLGRDFSTWKAA